MKRKVVCVCLNPAVDKNLFVDNLHFGSVNRVPAENIVKSAGGKGVNVAKVITMLSGAEDLPDMTVDDLILTGFIAGPQGDYIMEEMNSLGVAHDFVGVRGDTRTSLNIVDRDRGEETEILEEGFSVGASKCKEFMKKLDKLISDGPSVLILSGGIPSGLNASIYAEIIQMAKQHDSFIILDSSGEAYRLGVDAGPDLIKPNSREMSQLCREKLGDRTVNDEDGQSECAAYLVDNAGIKYVVVSAGPECVRMTSMSGVQEINPPYMQAVNTIGSGDSMIGGISCALASGKDISEALKWGVACGAANTLNVEVGKIDPSKVKEIYETF